MEYKKIGDEIYLRIDKGEKVMETIKAVCKKEKVCGGHFQGIGACGSATLSTYLPAEKDFLEHTLAGMLEMVSLTGNISAAGCELFLHSHAVFSYLSGAQELAVAAGHLKEAEISYTGEVVITPTDQAIDRKTDPQTGIGIWKLS